MKVAVADTSLALKWVIEEEDSSAAVTLRRHYRFIAPDLIYSECTNVFWRLLRSGNLPAEAISAAMRALLAEPVDIHPVRPLMAAALRIAVVHDHPAYDCIFAALALQERCPMITADKSFSRKMALSGIDVMTVQSALVRSRLEP